MAAEEQNSAAPVLKKTRPSSRAKRDPQASTNLLQYEGTQLFSTISGAMVP
jgi:hypothetical protein